MLSIRREYQLTALGVPKNESLSLPSADVRAQAITVDNTSNCTIGVWFDRDAAAGSPSTTIAPSSYKTIPINAARVGIAFAPPDGAVPAGLAYVELTDAKLSASAGMSAPSAVGATAIWDQSNWDSGATMGS